MMAFSLPAHADFVCKSMPGEASSYTARLTIDGAEATVDGMDDEAVARGLTVHRRKNLVRLIAITKHEREFAVWGELRRSPDKRNYRLTWHLRPHAPGDSEIWSRAQCVRTSRGMAR